MIESPFSPYDILAPYVTDAHPDDIAIYYVLNDLFAREPERFGSEETRAKIIDELRTIDDGYFEGAQKLAAIFERHGVSPLEGVRIIHIAPGGGLHKIDALTSEAAAYIKTPLYQQFYAVPAKGELNLPDYCHASELVKDEKFDYVITGNVINEPENRSPLDTLAASAMLLKQGGLALHMVGRSEISSFPQYYPRIIDADTLVDSSSTIPAASNRYTKINDLTGNQNLAERMGQRFEGELSGPEHIILLRQEREIDQLPDFFAQKKVDVSTAITQGVIEAAQPSITATRQT